MIERSPNNNLTDTIGKQVHDLALDVAKASELMATLENAMRSPSGIVDPDLQQAKKVLKELERIVPEIQSQWQAIQQAKLNLAEQKDSPPDSEKKIKKMIQKFAVVVRATKSIMSKIMHSLVANERNIELVSAQKTEFKFDQDDQVNTDDIGFFNDTVDELNQNIASIAEQYTILKKETNHISRIELAKKVSVYMTYGTAATKAGVTAWLAAWIETLKQATQVVGTIFYPISATFSTLIQFLNFGYRIVQYRVAHNELKDPNITEQRRRELEHAKAELRKSIVFRSLSSILNAISILAFLGVIFTPVGAGLVAAASIMVWVDEGLSPYLRAKDAVNKFKKNNPGPLSDDERLEFEAREDRVKLKKSAAFWTGAPIFALVFVACAPIPIVGPILSMVGAGIIGAVTARNTYVTVKKLYIKRKQKKRREREGRAAEEDGYEMKELFTHDRSPRSSHSYIISSSPQVGPTVKAAVDSSVHLEEAKAPAALKRSASAVLFTPVLNDSTSSVGSRKKLKRSDSMPVLKNKSN